MRAVSFFRIDDGRSKRGVSEAPARSAGSPHDRSVVVPLCRDLLDYFISLWTFTRWPGVEPTNNLAERELRLPSSGARAPSGARARAGSASSPGCSPSSARSGGKVGECSTSLRRWLARLLWPAVRPAYSLPAQGATGSEDRATRPCRTGAGSFHGSRCRDRHPLRSSSSSSPHHRTSSGFRTRSSTAPGSS